VSPLAIGFTTVAEALRAARGGSVRLREFAGQPYALWLRSKASIGDGARSAGLHSPRRLLNRRHAGGRARIVRLVMFGVDIGAVRVSE